MPFRLTAETSSTTSTFRPLNFPELMNSKPDILNVPIAPLHILWGSFETIETVSRLADCLVREWPKNAMGEAYLTALMVCEAVLRGSEDDTAEDARAAFIQACHELGLSVSDDDEGPDF